MNYQRFFCVSLFEDCPILSSFFHYTMTNNQDKQERKQKWSKTCTGASFLCSQFREYTESKGKRGIDPQTTDPATTKAIYHKFSHIFYNYSDRTFHSNFLKTVRNFDLGESKKRARKIGKCTMCRKENETS